MIGTTLTPEAALESLAGLNAGEQQLTASLMKQITPSSIISLRLIAICEKLASYIRNGISNEAKEFLQHCLHLSRYIDYAVERNEVLPKGSNLPLLLKQICQCRNIPCFQAVILVLMISVKNACKSGWFPDKENEELLSLAMEVPVSIHSLGEFKTGLSICQTTISTIMARFYPRMEMGQILTYIEVKPGYEAYVSDFQIAKNIASPRENIRLFVAHVDNLETSACIISPPQVNFLINGRGVDRRTNVLMDTGPQMPTSIAKLLKYGTNVIQAVGQFNGHYIIVVAFMSETSSPNVPALQDYVRPLMVVTDEDCDIIEGPSRISLNCPISYTRMKTPVKGHLCKHHQCFDFRNFIDINSRRPSWRCPHCNQYVCYLDIRIDQEMVKVLNQVGKDVSDIIISANGSWKAVMDTDDQIHESENCKKKKSELQESTSLSNAPPDVLDLTEDDNEVDVFKTSEIEDRKPLRGFNHNAAAARLEDDFWSGIYYTSGLGTSPARSDTHMFGSTSQSNADFVQAPPVLTDAISPAISREDQLQQLQFPISNEYGRFPTVPVMVTRTPIAVQALPVPSQVPGLRQRSRACSNSSPPISSSASQVSLSPAANGFNSVCGDVETQQHFSRSHLNPLDVASSSSQHSSVTQYGDHQDRSFVPGQSVQQIAGIQVSSQLPRPFIGSLGLSDFRNAHLQQTLNPRIFPPMGQSSNVNQSPYHSQTQGRQGNLQVRTGHVLGTGISQPDRTMAVQRALQRLPSLPVQNQTSRSGLSLPVCTELRVPTADTVMDLPSEHNWRPGQMRGSLSGQAYADALSHLRGGRLPTQAAQPARPQSNLTSPLPTVASHMRILMANSRNAHDPQTHTNNIQ